MNAPRSSRFAGVELYSLYEASVQSVDADLDFIEQVWRREHGDRPHTLREDFCGTASLCARFVVRDAANRAFGVDLDPRPLAWGREHRLALLDEEAASRVELHQADVREPLAVSTDVTVAFNFSYWVFGTRAEMLGYFRAAHRGLRPGGMFLLDAFGGSDSECALSETTRIARSHDPDGSVIPAFRYTWEQASFNPVDHRIVCHIHFERGGRHRRRAFTYDWRFWTLTELRELLAEAGFRESRVYVEGWDDETDEPNGVFRIRKRFDNEGGWIAYIVGLR
jgi:SAM-dependent methyltransferase